MHNRLSNSVLEKGDFNIDTEGPGGDELNFGFYADWGHLMIRWPRGGGKTGVFHAMHHEPEWGSLGEWLEQVEGDLLAIDEGAKGLHISVVEQLKAHRGPRNLPE